MFKKPEIIDFDYDLALDQIKRFIRAIKACESVGAERIEKLLSNTLYETFSATIDTPEGEKEIISSFSQAIKYIDNVILDMNPNRGGGDSFNYETRKNLISLYKMLKPWFKAYSEYYALISSDEYVKRIKERAKAIDDVKFLLNDLMKVYNMTS